jgi:hypothetical protein
MAAGKWEGVIEPSGALGRRAASLLDSMTSELLDNPALDAALFLAYRGEAEQNPRWMKRAIEHLNTAILSADAAYSTRSFHLFGGLAGLGWAVEHVIRQLNRFRASSNRDSRATDGLNGDTDAALLLELQRGRWRGSYDLVSGLTGIGSYFLKRLPAPNAKVGLELVLAHLEAAAGPATILNGKLGVANGLAGLLYLLSEAAAAGVGSPGTRCLLTACEQAVLEGQEGCEKSCFWWDGSLGIAAVRLRPAHASTFERVLEQCIKCAPEGDASLPRGTAGAAHMWGRFYGWLSDPKYRAAALRWWEHAISCAETTTPAARAAGVEFLAGSAGFGLALSAALTPVEPEWDGILGLSTPNTA